MPRHAGCAPSVNTVGQRGGRERGEVGREGSGVALSRLPARAGGGPQGAAMLGGKGPSWQVRRCWGGGAAAILSSGARSLRRDRLSVGAAGGGPDRGVVGDALQLHVLHEAMRARRLPTHSSPRVPNASWTVGCTPHRRDVIGRQGPNEQSNVGSLSLRSRLPTPAVTAARRGRVEVDSSPGPADNVLEVHNVPEQVPQRGRPRGHEATRI